MDAISQRTFGLIIAYVLPGIVVLWGISIHSPAVENWLSAAPSTTPTVGGFLYVVLASLGNGLVVSGTAELIGASFSGLAATTRFLAG